MSAQTELPVERGLDALLARVESTLEQTGEEFPYYADPDTGDWETTPDGDWCGGHWIGLLWLAAEHADDPTRYERAGRKLAKTVREDMPANSMFRAITLKYAGFDGYDLTGDRDLFALGLTGADEMVTLFDENARQVPLGEYDLRGPDNFRGPGTDDAPSGLYIGAVDNIYTVLPLLWRAYRATNDTRFRDVAVSHADRHLDWYIRPDGSTWHHAVFDAEQGELQYQYNELAHSDETCWARGQGWNIAGLSFAYNATGSIRYLDALERTTNYYVDNSPEDLVAYWDFEAPTIPDTPRDTSAAALTAYGLLGLEGDGHRVSELRATGKRILQSLLEEYTVLDSSDSRYGMVRETCYNNPGQYVTKHETIWTDFYVATALSDYLDRWD